MSKDHFVPEAYLRGFTNPDGTFYRWRVKYLSIGQAYPAGECYKEGYYNIDPEFMKKHKITDPQAFEHYAFKDYEDDVSTIVRRLESRATKIKFDMLVTLCRGYVLQHIRTPYYEKGVIQLEQKQGEQIKRNTWQNLRNEYSVRLANIDHPNVPHYLSDDFWEKIYKDVIDKPFDSKGTQQHSLFHTITGMSDSANNAVDRLLMMDFQVLVAPKDCYIITSDNPGFSFVPDKNLKTYRTSSFHFDTMVNVIYPLSNKLAAQLYLNPPVYTKPVDRNVKYIPLNEDDTYNLNRDTLAHCDEKVFCCNKEYLTAFRDRINKAFIIK